MTLSGSFVHEIFQLRIQECVAIFFPQRILPTQESNKGLLHCRRILYQLSFQSGLMYVVSSGSEVNVNLASFLIFTSGRKRRLMFISDCSVVLLGQFEIWIFEAVEISS